MRKYFWCTAILLILTIGLTACGLSFEEAKKPKEPINVADWPTPVPTGAVASPTPFPKISLPPTATSKPRPADEEQPATTVSPPTPPTAADASTYLSALADRVGALGGLSPVAVAFTTDSATVRQGPSGTAGVVETVQAAELVGVLGQNDGGDWLYVITITAVQGWLPIDSLRITGTLAKAPVVPDNPLQAALAQAISIAGSNPETTASAVSAAGPQTLTVTDLKPVATARVNSASLNVRQRPGASYKLLDTLAQDDEVKVLALNQDKQWALIGTVDQKSGWVAVDLLDIEGDLAKAPQVRTLTPPESHPSDQPAPMIGLSSPGQSNATAAGNTGSTATGSSAAIAAVAQSSSPVLLPGNTLAPAAEALVSIKVDLRRGPGETFGAVDTLTVDEKVTILAANEPRDWVVVQASSSRLGWVPLDSLKDISGNVANTSPVLTAWVDSNALDVKRGPGIYFDTVGKLAINDLVSVLALNKGKNWALVETVAGGQGWLPLRFLTISGSLANVPEVDLAALTAAGSTPDEALPKPPAIPSGTLVFQLASGGDIMVINADGSGLRRLTNGIDPSLSPDGQTVAFTRWQGETGSLWLIDIDGSNERQILDYTKQAKGPSWSPDGSQIVINYQQGGRLEEKSVCEDLDDDGVRPPGNASHIRFKIDDGDPQLCWRIPPDLFWNLRVVKVADGQFEDLDGGTYAFRPAWDPTRPWRIVSDGGRGLLEVDLNRNSQQRITDNVTDGSPVFSPDGRFIAVTAGPQGGGSQGHDIYRLNADGSGRVRLTQTPLWIGVQPEKQPQWNNVAPVWSPAGSQIAFLTDRTGRWEIWIMNIDGSNQRPFFSEKINSQLDIRYDFVDEQVLSWR